MAITIQQIHATADQLQEQGIKPTLRLENRRGRRAIDPPIFEFIVLI